MNFNLNNWIEVPIRLFRVLYEASNASRVVFNNGHLFVASLGSGVQIGFATKDARIFVSQAVHAQHF